MANELSRLTWPRDRRDEAAAAATGGGPSRPLPVEGQEIEAEIPDLDAMLRTAPPALLALDIDSEERFLALARRRGPHLIAVAPDGAEHAIPVRDVVDHLRKSAFAAAPPREGLLALLSTMTGGSEDRHAGVRRQRVLDELIGPARIRGCWLLRRRDGVRGRAREAGLWRWIAPFVGAHALQLALWIGAWMLLGAMAARADFGPTPLAALGLALGTMVGCRAVEAHAARMIALGAGTIIKRRLLDGSLRLGPDEVRRRGFGEYLARVLDTEAIETAGLTGAFLAINAVGGVIVTAVILHHGAGGGSHALLFLGWAAGLCGLSALAYVRRRRWTEGRLALTAHGVEQMVGHQTRLAQEDPARRHDGEDELLAVYVADRRALDRATVAVELGRRGWMYAGLIALAGPFVGGAATGTAFVVSVGGVLLGYQALSNATQSLARLSAAVIALRNLRAFWREPEAPAPATRDVAPSPTPADATMEDSAPVIEARGLGFCHSGRRDPVVRQAGLAIGRNDHVLLVGPSGSGKSTLAALLAGLRRPDSGLLLFRGLDRDTLGSDAWRRGIVLAPQFQENHLLVGPLAYNLLLGRRWPPTPADLEEAAALCEDLGLGPLLARMPLGLYQPVGESGWQLSHGERSRVFAARAILQKPDLLILDESFAALDPATFAQTLRLVVARSSAVMLIAHP
jgi:ATP-binding cassette subfamily B protein